MSFFSSRFAHRSQSMQLGAGEANNGRRPRLRGLQSLTQETQDRYARKADS
jgi:hypothetical protein